CSDCMFSPRWLNLYDTNTVLSVTHIKVTQFYDMTTGQCCCRIDFKNWRLLWIKMALDPSIAHPQ
ncbi:MAG: hypothetical protein ACPHV3_00175, partial [Vibrio sp.]